jgi:opacity protein-like surface antigen
MNKNDRALWVARLLMLCAASILAAACGSDTPTTAPPAPTYPNVSGVWQGTFVELVASKRTFTAKLTLTQAEGSRDIIGTVESTDGNNRFTETITTGTQSGLNVSLDTVLTNSVGVAYRYQGRMDPSGTEMDGTIVIPPGAGTIATWSVRR